MPLPVERIYTIDDIYALPEGKRAELIDGQIYYMAPSNTRHQRIVNCINTEINLHIRTNNGSCEVFPAPFAVFLNENDTNYVEPDISVICDRDKLTDQGCNGAPDWIIEVVSPSSKAMDYGKKLFKYRTAGVTEYWIVDPGKNRVLTWNFQNGDVGDYSFTDDISSGIYPGFSITLTNLDI